MKVPRTAVVRTLGTGALIAITASVSLAAGAGGDRPRATAAFVYQKIEFAVFKGDTVQGIVTTAQRSKGGRARVTLSLDGYDPGPDYRVIGSRRGCSKPATTTSSYVYIEINDRQPTKFAETTAPGKVMAAKSVRIFARPESGEYTQIACTAVLRDM
jgi:hypothetical protein